MATTLSDLKQSLTAKLATTNTTFHTEAVRTEAINEAITDICESYDVNALFKRATLTIASAICTIPTDMLRVVKIWDPTNQSIEYEYIPEDLFDPKASTEAYYWTVDYDVATLVRVMKFLPATTTSDYISYKKVPTHLENDSDVTDMPDQFLDGIAYGAAAILLRNEASFERSQSMSIEGDAMVKKAVLSLRNVGGVKQHLRLRSVFEKQSILDGIQQ
jgi:hypothetical protein